VVRGRALFLFPDRVPFRRRTQSGIRPAGISRFPVLLNGRIKPLDTVARTSLLILCGKQSLRVDDGQSLSAIEWLTELMARPEAADDRKVFKITNPDTLGALGLQEEENKNYSFSQFVPRARTSSARLNSPIMSRNNCARLFNATSSRFMSASRFTSD